jgi:sirohydrochlorin ferrochelatase
MSVRTVGIARAPAGLSPAEFNARVQGVADTLLALPISASAITKYELVRRSLSLSGRPIVNLFRIARP